ncbi:hypothetical protein PISL3812_02882 [Talaromyces islandicus]|uniref:Nucleoside phosphorylase domain-containing protein n=1 Tax=Talaromyces islandicus TaxID=28573 RepID=A0A0U1LR49_TALIS|nr:hypothetical protein PISL3812_02882 [Talaromyces islandicus]
MPPQSRKEFEIAIICALPVEADAVEALLDEHYDIHTYGKQEGDDNAYAVGRIGGHHVVLAFMPGMGNRNSASVARGLRVSFTEIKLALLVGICGGAPYSTDNTEIILGDVIISDSVIEYDFGRQYPDGFVRKSGVKDTFGQPNQEIRSLLNSLRTSRKRSQIQRHIMNHLKDQGRNERDWCYPGVSQDRFQDPVCELALKSDCRQLGCAEQLIQRGRLDAGRPEVFIHIGTVASANTVMRSGEHRDRLAENAGIIAFEMEGAGVWDNLPCIIIKGVCDYADCHKTKAWQSYAAATAASCTKAFLTYWRTGLQQQQLSNSLANLGLETHHGEELTVFLQILQYLKASFPNPDTDYDPTSIREPIKKLLGKHYKRFSYISSLCLTVFLKEFLELFGAHLTLFLYMLMRCGSEVPKLLVGADIVFEDVFLDGRGKQYVATGLFRLYDYKGSPLTKERWQELVPNSKVSMSVIIQLSEHNICGRCFKYEDTQEPGIATCSNCGLKYSKIGLSDTQPKATTPRITEITEKDEISAKGSGQGRSTSDGRIDSALGYNRELARPGSSAKTIVSALGHDPNIWEYIRVDFHVGSDSQTLCSVIEQLKDLILSMRGEFAKHAVPYPTPAETIEVLASMRSCYSQIEGLLEHYLFRQLDDNIFLLSHKVDDYACLNIQQIWNQLRYEAMRMWRGLQPKDYLNAYQGLSNLLQSCEDSLKALKASLDQISPSPQPQPASIDDAFLQLGIRWQRVNPDHDLDMATAIRGWEKYINNHFAGHLHDARILIKNRTLNAYLVAAIPAVDIPSVHTCLAANSAIPYLEFDPRSYFYLFEDDMTKSRLVGSTVDICLRNLQSTPIEFEGSDILQAFERSPEYVFM